MSPKSAILPKKITHKDKIIINFRRNFFACGKIDNINYHHNENNRGSLSIISIQLSTFMAPLVAIALSDIPVRKVHKPQSATNNRDSHTPAIPTILQFS